MNQESIIKVLAGATMVAKKTSESLKEKSSEYIKEKILQINPNYNFAFEDGHVPNDILVAHLQ